MEPSSGIIREKMMKLYRLAQQGVGGEKENAWSLLEKALKKHGLTLEDIAEEKKQTYKFYYKSSFQRRLIFQVLALLINDEERNHKDVWWYKHPEMNVGASLTKSEYMLASAMIEWHRAQFKKETESIMDDLLTAYIAKHDIYPDHCRKSNRKNSDEPFDFEKALRISSMMSGLEDKTYRKRIGTNK